MKIKINHMKKQILAVIHLHKTLKKSRGTFAVVSGVTYEIRMEGEITVIEADNSEALGMLPTLSNQWMMNLMRCKKIDGVLE